MEEASSVFITTVNKEKYRCSLPSISKNSDKASIHVFVEFVFCAAWNYSNMYTSVALMSLMLH